MKCSAPPRATESSVEWGVPKAEGNTPVDIPFAPPDLPASTLTSLRHAFDGMVKDPEFIADADRVQAERDAMSGERLQKLIEAGTEPMQSTPQEFSDYRRKEAAKWADAVKKAGIALD